MNQIPLTTDNTVDGGHNEEEEIYKEMAELEVETGSQEVTTGPGGPATLKPVPVLLVPALCAGTLPATATATAAWHLQQGPPTATATPSALGNNKLRIENTVMDTESACQMPNIYYQSRAARDATFCDSACDISGGENLGATVGGEIPRVGSFENNAKEMGLCFTGTRIKRGTDNHQNGSFSFDPATMTCIACEKSHPIFVKGESAGICLADQNFPPNLSGSATEKGCIATIRIESAGLAELVEIFEEIFAGIPIPPGTTICIGSATQLHRSGPTIYATEWTKINAVFAKNYPGTHICPLVPVLAENFPGSLAVSIAAITAWFSSIYASGNRGLLPVWAEASRIACECAMPDPVDQAEKIFVVYAFPDSLHPDAKLIPRRVAISRSCRVLALMPDAKANKELVCMLLARLHAEYLISYRPGTDPVRTPPEPAHTKDSIKRAILYGNSNVRQCVPALQALGYSVVDRTEIHWDGSDSAADAIRLDASAHTGNEDTAFVFDFLGPSAYRFKQSDGSLAMPVKFSGGFHLLGEAAVADDAIIRGCVKRLVPVLVEMCRRPTVLIPPLPRFVFGGCCRLKNHSVGSGSDEAAKKMIDQFGHLRKTAKAELQKISIENWWLADTMAALGGEDPMGSLKLVTAKDNVHFSGLGYSKIATEIKEGFSKLEARISQKKPKTTTYYWHGFASNNGSPGPRDGGRGPRGGGRSGGRGRGAQHGRWSRPHPYSR